MFIRCGVSSEVVDGHNWNPMRKAISPILDYLNASRHAKIHLDNVIANILTYTDCNHLLLMGDGKSKKVIGEDALAKLRNYFEKREKAKVDQCKAEETRKIHQNRINEYKDFQQQLANIKQKFTDCSGNTNLQSRGYQFEIILNELFTLFDLAPKKPFRRTGEQIDGAFIHQNTHFLLEAKWCNSPSDLNDLRDLDASRLSDRTIREQFYQLQDHKIIKAIGHGRGAKWVLRNKPE